MALPEASMKVHLVTPHRTDRGRSLLSAPWVGQRPACSSGNLKAYHPGLFPGKTSYSALNPRLMGP